MEACFSRYRTNNACVEKNDMGGEVKKAIVCVEEKNIKRGFIEKK